MSMDIVITQAYKIPGHTTSVLGQRHENEWKQSRAHVPATSGPVKVRKRLVLYVEERSHELVPSTV
jgi:hypothetical protein